MQRAFWLASGLAFATLVVPSERGGSVAWLAAAFGNEAAALDAAREPDPLGQLGLRATTGPAAGYLADSACRMCHLPIWESYQQVGMARSMRRPAADAVIEDFDHAGFTHQPSQEHYRISWRDGALQFRRWQSDAEGNPINVFEQKVDWIVGSGHRSRVYLYQDPAGELFQLPVAWYTEERSWGMAPGFDRPDHLGVGREVQRECLFCHNAYPEVADGSDQRWAPNTFPTDLPQGIGCQRCHGPAAGHVRAVLKGQPLEHIRAAIVNPARLEKDARDSVCFQCHFQPTVAIPRPVKFERADYSFRPGEKLYDYLLYADVDEADRTRAERFEINHHAYRLEQSGCYRKGLTCIDCHDPHQALKHDPRLANAKSVCLRCHTAHDARPGAAQADTDNCVGCHMPRRRTQDVVHVVMTDHRIQRQPPTDALAPRTEGDPTLVGVELLDPGAPKGALGEVYRAVTVLRINPRSQEALRHLIKNVAAAPRSTPSPRLDLIAALLAQRRFDEAKLELDSVEPEAISPLVESWRGIAAAGVGDLDAALTFQRKAAAQADQPEFHFNLGVVLHDMGREQEAIESLTRAVTSRPTLAKGWLIRGHALAAAGKLPEAIADYQRALSIQPSLTRAYAALVQSLKDTGDDAAAQRWLRHGIRVAADPEGLRRATSPAPSPEE